MDVASPSHRLTAMLRYYSRRVRRDLRSRYVGAGVALAGAVWCLAAVAAYLDIALPEGTWIVCLGLTLALPLIGFLVATMRSPSMRGAATLIDSRLDDRQRLVTAMELVDAGPLPPVAQAQVSTTADMLASVHPDVVYPVRAPVAHYSLGLGLVAVALGLLFLKTVGNGFNPISQGDVALSGSPTPLAVQSPTPQSGLPNSDATQPPSQDQANNNAVPGVDPQDAQRKAEESQKAQDALNRLKSALDEQSATQDAADSLRQGNYGDAANKLGELGTQNDQLSDTAKQGLSDSLKRAANDSSQAPDLQQAERNAADALQNGEYKDISSALKDLGDAVKNTAQAVVPQQELTKGFPTPQPGDSQQGQQGQQSQQQGDQSGKGQQSGQQGQENSQTQGQGQGQQSQDSSGNSQDGQGQTGQGSQQSNQGQGQGQGNGGGGNDTGKTPAEGQNGGSGKGDSRVSGPANYNPRTVQGDPFQLEGKGDPSQTSPGDPNNPNQQPGLSLQESSDGAGPTLPPQQGGPVTAPGESNQVPVERWGIIQKYFSHDK